jgi:hypothetical protein
MVRATTGYPEKQKAARTFARNGLWACGTPQVGYLQKIRGSADEFKDNPLTV